MFWINMGRMNLDILKVVLVLWIFFFGKRFRMGFLVIEVLNHVTHYDWFFLLNNLLEVFCFSLFYIFGDCDSNFILFGCLINMFVKTLLCLMNKLR